MDKSNECKERKTKIKFAIKDVIAEIMQYQLTVVAAAVERSIDILHAKNNDNI